MALRSRTIAIEKTYRIVIADSDINVRSALSCLLDWEPGARVVGETASAENLINSVVKHRADLVLIDWNLLANQVSRLLSELRAARPGIVIIALSVRPETRARALDAGIDAFICKGESPATLLSTLRPFINC